MRFGALSLVLPSAVRMPSVSLDQNAIELDLVSFTGKIVFGVPGMRLDTPDMNELLQASSTQSPVNSAAPLFADASNTTNDSDVVRKSSQASADIFCTQFKSTYTSPAPSANHDEQIRAPSPEKVCSYRR